MKRKSNFELLRIIAMIFIILHHFVVHQPDSFINMNIMSSSNFIYSLFFSGGKFGVALFIMITGYFMIDKDFKFIKLIKLELQVLFYTISIFLLATIFNINEFSLLELFKSLFPIIFKKYWFVISYFILMLFVPYINKSLNSLSKNDYIKLLIICSILVIVSNIKLEYINETIMMLYYYIIGSYIKKYNQDFKRIEKLSFILSITFYLLMSISIIFLQKLNYSDTHYYTHIGSIFNFISAVSLFIWFSLRDLTYSKLINNISSICFSIYLFHDNPIVRKILWQGIFKINNCNNVLLLIDTGFKSVIFIFFITFIIETFRKMLFKCISTLLNVKGIS